ncbi:MAG: EVE domain-containing protein [Acidobacteriaceae bacterium]|nr:EVE domain-containing protein [Acidobacteriaceae bacterium]
MHYLLKSEPDQYSIADLERERETLWDGVSNPVAVRHLSEMKPHDKLIYYHTGNERQAVGTAVVSSVDNGNPKSPRVHIRFAGRLNEPVSLAEIKANKLFADSPLIRQGRLSVVPLTTEQYDWLTKA